MKNGLVIILGGLFFVMVITMQSSCYYDKESVLYPNLANCDTVSVSYANEIVPILSSQCYTCHSTANASNGGNNDLSVYTSLLTFVKNGKLLCDLNHESGCNAMPMNSTSKIDPCSIEKISAWINAGAPQN